jgi:hypothetical protein
MLAEDASYTDDDGSATTRELFRNEASFLADREAIEADTSFEFEVKVGCDSLVAIIERIYGSCFAS